MLSTLQHFTYCPRQAALLMDGVWDDNHLTVQGDRGHANVDAGGRVSRRGVRVHHAVPLASQRLRIHGVADAIEESRTGALMPVEHKHGRGAGDLRPTLVQVVAQALCLEEMTGRHVHQVAIYITKEHRRELFDVSDHAVMVEDLILEARAKLAEVIVPHYSPRLCSSCSVRNACQPLEADWR